MELGILEDSKKKTLKTSSQNASRGGQPNHQSKSTDQEGDLESVKRILHFLHSLQIRSLLEQTMMAPDGSKSFGERNGPFGLHFGDSA